MPNMDKVNVIVKTKRGYEKVVASLIEDILPKSEVIPKPSNYAGLVLVYSDKEDTARIIRDKIPEAEKVLPVKVVCKADLRTISENLDSIVDEIDDCFAVRTKRRGKHSFSSIDVNVLAGEIIRERTGMDVNLDFPEKVVFIEIIGDYAYIGVVDGRDFPKKRSREKIEIRNFFRKVSVFQMPYLGDIKASREMGIRIGREAQTFEIGELIISPIGKSKADELKEFIDGVYQGIESRYAIQRRTYSHKPRKVNVYVQNLYEGLRERKDEDIVVFEPEGRPINKISKDLAEIVIKNKRVNFLIGSREGIPTGVYRFAKLVIDLCPGITIATDFAISSAMIALSFSLQENLDRFTKVP